MSTAGPKRERLLVLEGEQPCGFGHVDQQVQGARAHHAWHDNKRVLVEQVVAESLLVGADRAGAKPVRVGYVRPLNDARARRLDA